MAAPKEAKPLVNHPAASQAVVQLLDVIDEFTKQLSEKEEDTGQADLI